MIRLNVTAEGFSEERFVSDIIRPHLLQYGIYTDVRKTLTSRRLKVRGGIVGFDKFKRDVTQWIKEDPQAYHTTFIDLYGLTADFPQYAATKTEPPYQRIKKIEDGLAKEISFHKFIPYIQLHEYEALLFANTKVMEDWIGLYNPVPVGHFQKIVYQCGQNPEFINDDPSTAPSKRILSICPAYNKVADGILILKEIGLNMLRAKCEHFDNWISNLEKLK